MVKKFNICKNDYLNQTTIGYYNRYYTGYQQPDNPDFLNTLKNTFNGEAVGTLNNAKEEVKNILLADIPYVMSDNKWVQCVCVCIPRAKSLTTYTPNQLFFRDAVSSAVSQMSNVIDRSNFIVRHTDTFTTHLKKATAEGKIPNNIGEEPYPGITKDTCSISGDKIKNQSIILIDDIYTQTINIDEDCIQALLDNGAKNVIFYAIAYTKHNE